MEIYQIDFYSKKMYNYTICFIRSGADVTLTPEPAIFGEKPEEEK
jgi:hypothetical protein